MLSSVCGPRGPVCLRRDVGRNPRMASSEVRPRVGLREALSVLSLRPRASETGDVLPKFVACGEADVDLAGVTHRPPRHQRALVPADRAQSARRAGAVAASRRADQSRSGLPALSNSCHVADGSTCSRCCSASVRLSCRPSSLSEKEGFGAEAPRSPVIVWLRPVIRSDRAGRRLKTQCLRT